MGKGRAILGSVTRKWSTSAFASMLLLAAAILSSRNGALDVTVFPVEFSADLVTTEQGNPEPPMVGKVYVSKARIRVDTSSDGMGIGQLVNLEKRESWNIFYKIKEARDMSATTAEFEMYKWPGVPKPSFYSTKPFDPVNACRTFTTVRTCTKLQIENVNGRDCQKMVIQDTVGATTTAWLTWVDLELFYPVKVQSGVRTVELKDIRVGPQPDSVFEVPPGFRRTVHSDKDISRKTPLSVKH